jgi:hypothetical protein
MRLDGNLDWRCCLVLALLPNWKGRGFESTSSTPSKYPFDPLLRRIADQAVYDLGSGSHIRRWRLGLFGFGVSFGFELLDGVDSGVGREKKDIPKSQDSG